jgi:predicted amidohydrolase YtcJ
VSGPPGGAPPGRPNGPPDGPPNGVERRRRGPVYEAVRPPDRILVGAHVWTGVSPGLTPLEDTAVALRDDRIAAVGPTERVLRSRGPRTVVVELEGGCLVPGFVDAHVHLQAGGLDLFRVDLRGVTTREGFELRVGERARSLPPGSWILGGGWDHHRWGGALPHRSWLDRVAPHHPVFLLRTDLHVGVVNSLALKLAGLGAETPDPPLGRLERDPDTGELTGVIRESGLHLVSQVVPPPGPGERETALRAAARHALRHGVTQVHDMGALQSSEESWASLFALRELHARGELPLRVSAAVPLEDRHRLAQWVAEEGGGDDRLRWGSVKAFVDGSLGADTAWFLEDYHHRPGHRGGPIADLESLATGLAEATGLGLQPIVHAIGDAATAWLVAEYRELCRRYAGRDLRLRMEHAQHLAPTTLKALGHPGILASMQPAHLVDDGAWAEARIGAKRVEGAFAFASLLRRGVRPAFGSDWTVAPLDPLGALHAAVTRQVPGPDGLPTSWNPRERISVGQALRAHTLDASRAAFLEGETGSLEPGKRADLVLLSASPFDLPLEAWSTELEVRATLVDGGLAWQSDDGGLG